ncbi:hypothetical protein V2W45_1472037 [Cenococcum geophilum]
MSSPTSTASDQPSTVPPRLRSIFWNAYIYDANDTATVLSGISVDKDTFFLRGEGDTQIEKDNHPPQPGKYYILLRTISLKTRTCSQPFCDAVRSRDHRCVISGIEVTSYRGEFSYTGFEAAHVFPLAYEGHWIDNNCSRWITIPPEKGGTINSVQNGLLLRTDTPIDNYKIMFFMPNYCGFAGKHLDQRFLNNPQRPLDQLLRWHFRQAVLANMRGAGEPIFEHGFPPGSDVVGDILYGPKAAERMEFELFSRLGAQRARMVAELLVAQHYRFTLLIADSPR